MSSSPPSPAAARILKREPLPPADAKWTRSVKITYADPTGRERVWESCERATRPADTPGVDGVGVVAILEGAGGPSILLQRQYRPPVDKVCIEVPAGLVDAGETVGVAAVRELHEETGYRGELVEGEFAMTPVMYNGKALAVNRLTADPGFTNTNVVMAHVRIDTARPENQDPQPQLEPGEFIECFTVPLRELYAECRRLEAAGFAIDARVGTLAEGIELAKRWRL